MTGPALSPADDDADDLGPPPSYWWTLMAEPDLMADSMATVRS